MFTIKNSFRTFLLIFFGVLILTGCGSGAKDSSSESQTARFHSIPFEDSSLHGPEAKKNLAYCQECHGAKGTIRFFGGVSPTSCSKAGCHPDAGAHPTRWQGSNDLGIRPVRYVTILPREGPRPIRMHPAASLQALPIRTVPPAAVTPGGPARVFLMTSRLQIPPLTGRRQKATFPIARAAMGPPGPRSLTVEVSGSVVRQRAVILMRTLTQPVGRGVTIQPPII
jgi:hypothetical protein